MNLLCPACHAPLPAAGNAVVSCPACAAEIDLSRAGTAVGKPRFVPERDRTGDAEGGFRLERRLGSGGMGTVYAAVDADGRPAAVKFLAPALADDAALVARFEREIEALARLDHPGIVRVRAHGASAGVPWFAMDLVDGKDLRARLAHGPLPPSETATVFGALLAALGHAHARGIVHRDLKPANVLLAKDGARLADFGVALLDAAASSGASIVTRLTDTAAIIGTLPYMAPEQKRGAAMDGRADLYALGVMLYEAATGVLPQGAFAAPSAVNRAYGKAFDRVVLRLLQPDPAARFTSAAATADALASALAPARSRRFVLAAGAALGAAGLALPVLGRLYARADKVDAPVQATKTAASEPTALAPKPTNVAPQVAPEPPRVSQRGLPGAPSKSKVASKPVPKLAPRPSKKSGKLAPELDDLELAPKQ